MNQHDKTQMMRKALEDIAAHYPNSWAADTANQALAAQVAPTERAPLVRLTDEEARDAYVAGEIEATNRGLPTLSRLVGLRKVMDAMIEKNNGEA